MIKERNKASRLIMISLIISVFSLGFISAYLLMLIENPREMPLSFSSKSYSVAPSNVLTEKDIKLYDDRVIIYLDNAKISRYASTGSMVPILNENSNGIKIVPKTENDIKVGDIITFREEDNLIVHRVVEKGVDENGTYFITKGDNNPLNDGKVRFSNIESKTIGILY